MAENEAQIWGENEKLEKGGILQRTFLRMDPKKLSSLALHGIRVVPVGKGFVAGWFYFLEDHLHLDAA